MGKSIISMAIFNSYVKLPEGRSMSHSSPGIQATAPAYPAAAPVVTPTRHGAGRSRPDIRRGSREKWEI